MPLGDSLDRFALLEPVSWANCVVFGGLSLLNLWDITQGHASPVIWLFAVGGAGVCFCALALSFFVTALAIFDGDRFIPWKDRVTLVDGNIEHSVPKFVEGNPGVRFSLVHFDCDLYEPTRAALAVADALASMQSLKDVVRAKDRAGTLALLKEAMQRIKLCQPNSNYAA